MKAGKAKKKLQCLILSQNGADAENDLQDAINERLENIAKNGEKVVSVKFSLVVVPAEGGGSYLEHYCHIVFETKLERKKK